DEIGAEIRRALRARGSAIAAAWTSAVSPEAAARVGEALAEVAARSEDPWPDIYTLVGQQTAESIESAVSTDVSANAHLALARAAYCLRASHFLFTSATHHASVAAAYAAKAVAHPGLNRGAWVAERAAQCVILRDIFGNPFRPVGMDPAWLGWNDRTVSKMAQHIDDGHRFELLPI